MHYNDDEIPEIDEIEESDMTDNNEAEERVENEGAQVRNFIVNNYYS